MALDAQSLQKLWEFRQEQTVLSDGTVERFGLA
jgi:hypothetical protein